MAEEKKNIKKKIGDAKGSQKINKRGTRKGPRRGRGREERKEFDQKIVSIRRVTRVVSGGRRFSFSVAMIIGNKKGKVGVGTGKAGDTALAIEKAFNNAKKNIVSVHLTPEMSLAHDAQAKYCSSLVYIKPAKGKGTVAGSSVRTVLEFAGVKDVSGKVISRSKNQLNNALATIKALKKMKKISKIS